MAVAASAAPRRIPARELLAQDELAAVRERVEWKGLALIAHAWAVIFGSIALVAVFPNPLTYILAVMLIGSRQLGLAILMHDGAHGCFPATRRATWRSANGCAPIRFSPTRSPIAAIISPIMPTRSRTTIPISCCRRRFRSRRRAIAASSGATSPGQTGYQQSKAQFLNALGDPSWPAAQRCAISAEAWAAAGRQWRAVRRALTGRRLVGLSAAVAGPAADLDDGHHAHPQHRRACGRAGLRRSAAQHADHQGEPRSSAASSRRTSSTIISSITC